ncbi:hypothetical protein C2U72_21865, partial [Prosthecomicrobium hirschii]|uniref:calcium-binding protein n=1 Tax=Prosthecodimorpha hirschii TaxID=665126 RepID=UPI00112A1DFA
MATITGDFTSQVLNGTASDDLIEGLGGNDTLNGLGGSDTLDGGTGADSMVGSTGDDTYVVDDVGDVVVELTGEGTDTVESSIDYTLGNYVENLVLTGFNGIDGTGNTLDNAITGNGGGNSLSGGDGNDTLDGGAGNDTLVGGLGNDTFVVDTISDSLVETAGQGTDTVQSSVTWTLATNFENLTLTGSGNINGFGNSVGNVIVGNSGNNSIDGGTGADTMSGGAGDDTFVVDDIGDVVSENANEGTDTVQSSIDYTLTANVENLVLTGIADIDGTGNGLANTITGNSGANSLAGAGGNDTLIGDGGVDTLDGGTGVDSMEGGTGDDLYIVDDTNDLAVETDGTSTGGVDTVEASASYTLGSYIEKLVLTGTGNISGTGNDLDNTITGNSGNNTIDGG